MVNRLFLFFALGALLIPVTALAAPADGGRIYLDVEDRGQAWYISPTDGEAHYLANGAVAYHLLREQGLGITNADLAKIPVGFERIVEPDFDGIFGILEDAVTDDCGEDFMCNLRNGHSFVKSGQAWGMVDTVAEYIKSFEDLDGDGLPARLEIALGTGLFNDDSDGDGYLDGDEIEFGYSPLSEGRMKTDRALVNRLKGRILLQVENNGEAWYVNPDDGKRYYMANGLEAFKMMSSFGRGANTEFIRNQVHSRASKLDRDGVADVAVYCDNIDCFADGFGGTAPLSVPLTYEADLGDIDPALEGVKLNTRILYDYVGRSEFDMFRLGLLQLRVDNLLAEDIINLASLYETLPEGLTTEEKAEAGRLMFDIKEYVIGGIAERVPEMVCVVYDRGGIDEHLRTIDRILTDLHENIVDAGELALDIEDDPVAAAADLEEKYSDLVEYFESDAVYCSAQGGLVD